MYIFHNRTLSFILSAFFYLHFYLFFISLIEGEQRAMLVVGRRFARGWKEVCSLNGTIIGQGL
jgi:hypothetical protein